MDFTLSSEQVLIKESVARFASGEHDGRDHWSTFAELGWLAIGAPDEAGGFGGPIETLLVAEQLGRGLVTSPYVTQGVLARTILQNAGDHALLQPLVDGTRRVAVAYEEPGARGEPGSVQTAAVRDGDGYVLRGRKVRALDTGSADTIIVSARTPEGTTLLTVPAGAPGLTRMPYDAEDGHDAADITFDGARADGVVGAPGSGLELLELGLDHALAAVCAEALGIASVMLEATVDYTKQRQQFDVPIGSFQALQHRMAEMFIEVELMRSMAFLAAMTLADASDAATRRRTISSAKVQIARSGRFVGQQAIQLHGGIGMSEEYRVGRYFKRLTILERLFGDATFHLARFGSSVNSAQREAVPA